MGGLRTIRRLKLSLMSCPRSACAFAFLLVAFVPATPLRAECAAALSLRGVGAAVAKQVKPYADCLNSTVGTPEQLRSACRDARATAAQSHDFKNDKAKRARAIEWLDAMVDERANCETRLNVKA